ncbi:MAG: EAL domain-containing protein [Methylococcales bacterium]|nr:EAL domain-containing protein [Methylococcales bacterium]MDP3837802.1 EAL domain-containing protein [Methylococcales bacterium]
MSKYLTFKVFGSIQRQLALTYGCVSLVMLLGLTGLLLKQQQNFLDDASIRRAMTLANSVAYSSSSWILANDVVGLSEILQGYRDKSDLDRAFIINLQGQVLASTQSQEVGLFITDNISLTSLAKSPVSEVLVANSKIIDVAAPVIADNRHIGWVRVALNQQTTQANLRAVLLSSLEFIVITVLIVLTLSTLLAKGMVHRLQQLIGVALSIAEGDRSVRADVQRDDEIGDLAININTMLDSLTHSEQQMDRLNHVYAAWTESIAAIVRETDELVLLDRICQILVEKINFRLVFIGFTDSDNDWIDFVACSDWQSPCMVNRKISVNPERPEGVGATGQAIREHKVQIFNDYLTNTDATPWQKVARANSIRSVAAFPLTRSGKVVGAISVYSQEVNYFNSDIITLINGLSADISFALDNFDREKQRQQAETELTLAASVFENSQQGIFITDAEKIIVRVNSAFSTLTGYDAEETIGRIPAQMQVSEQNNEGLHQLMWEQINAQGYWQGEINNCRKDGNRYSEWLTITQVNDKNGAITHYVGIFIDITERKLNEERIHKLAFYDALTKLPNRRLLIERLRLAQFASQRNHHHGALMFMDIDRFKILNDTQGHDIGDQLLVEVAKRIAHCVREQDTVARIGGDEFVIMLEGLSEHETAAIALAQRIGSKILDALNSPYLLYHYDQHGYSLPIEHHSSASIGMKLFQGTEIGSDDILKQADMAMYQAKQAGRNTLCVFDPDMQSRLNQRASLEVDMRQAMQNNQFCLYYQVQVNQQGYAVGAEVLLRWAHPVRGNISPAEFIPLAEESGLIGMLGLWTLSESCKTLAQWAKHPDTEGLTLAVNVSAKQFDRDNFVDQVKAILDRTGINPQRLKLEITESIILVNVEQIIDTMHILRRLGLSFSMDDFGTGYSSLSYLQRLPLSQLKIDQSFVRDLAIDNNDTAIIRTILALGSSLGLTVVAEGVENEQQRDYLISGGCDIFQGYLIGKPAPLALFEQQLHDLKPW